MVKHLKLSPLRLGTKQGISTLTSIQRCLEVLAKAIRQEKEINASKGRSKVFKDDMIISIETTKESTKNNNNNNNTHKNLLEIIN